MSAGVSLGVLLGETVVVWGDRARVSVGTARVRGVVGETTPRVSVSRDDTVIGAVGETETTTLRGNCARVSVLCAPTSPSLSACCCCVGLAHGTAPQCCAFAGDVVVGVGVLPLSEGEECALL